MKRKWKQRIQCLLSRGDRASQADLAERLLLAQGKQLATWASHLTKLDDIGEAEFRIFSQFGDDGIIQYLTSHIAMPSKTFIEFGIGDYSEANTRFLLMNNNWSGFVLDGSKRNIKKLKGSDFFWRHDLAAEHEFITVENVNNVLARRTFSDVGLLHIDIDGNDYWIWKVLDSISPALAIIEYNSVFGVDRAITIPYSSNFHRTTSHHSNLYFGASLLALSQLASEKRYAFVGCNTAGNNAYFVRKDLVNEHVKEISPSQGYRVSKFRESRNRDGDLTYLAGTDRLAEIRGLDVFNVESNQIETL